MRGADSMGCIMPITSVSPTDYNADKCKKYRIVDAETKQNIHAYVTGEGRMHSVVHYAGQILTERTCLDAAVIFLCR